MLRQRIFLLGSLFCVSLAATSARCEEQAVAKLPEYSAANWQELGVVPVPEKKEAESGFVVAGRNETKLIQQLKAINGRTIAELEKRFRNSARTVLSSPQVSGDKPSDRHPSHFGA